MAKTWALAEVTIEFLELKLLCLELGLCGYIWKIVTVKTVFVYSPKQSAPAVANKNALASAEVTASANDVCSARP